MWSSIWRRALISAQSNCAQRPEHCTSAGDSASRGLCGRCGQLGRLPILSHCMNSHVTQETRLESCAEYSELVPTRVVGPGRTRHRAIMYLSQPLAPMPESLGNCALATNLFAPYPQRAVGRLRRPLAPVRENAASQRFPKGEAAFFVFERPGAINNE